tara:strand:- start:1693 stop:2127 length:435 start_codon:yes stop_codon:yes gene_type:complete
MRNKKNIKQEFIYKCKVVRIVDGDTIDVDIDMGFGIKKIKQRCRTYNIDTPESRINTKDDELIGGKTLSQRRKEKKLGLASKARMKKLCGKQVYVESLGDGKPDKYGRLLANLFTLEGINIGKLLIDEGHAVKYDGGKKKHVWA